MTTVEAAPEKPAAPIFGEITLDDMRRNELLTRTVMKLVGEVCGHTKGRLDAERVADGVVSGAYGLFGVMRPPASLVAIAVTQKVGPIYEIVMAGPMFEDIAPFLSRIAGVGRSLGCTRISVTGPQWFRRHLPPEWHAKAVRLEMDLTRAP